MEAKPGISDRVDVQDLIAEYEAKTPRSKVLHERISKVLPGGETRTVTFYLPYPVAIDSAGGPYIIDVDGNQYVDLANNMTALVHGHRYQPVVDAIVSAMGIGTAHAGPHRFQLDFAELLQSRYPAFELLRFTNSGSEAALLALRIAQKATNRKRFAMFDGGYHGMAPQFIDTVADQVRLPYNDLDAVASVVDDSLAAVFIEPFLGSKGIIPAAPGFVEAVRELSKAAGAVFVLDEVQSLRNAPTGMDGSLGLESDLVIMGKAVGGGLPIGIVGGKRQLMEVASAKNSNGLVHSGTFNGNVVVSAAGYASMMHLTEARIETLIARATVLEDHLEAEGRRLRLPIAVTRAGSIMCVHFKASDPRDAAEAIPTSPLAAWWHIAALLEGVYVTRGGRMNLSTVMSEADIREVCAALTRALERLASIQRIPDVGEEGQGLEWVAGR